MVALPNLDPDLTLDAVDKALEEKQENRPQNGRIYMSQITRDCDRKEWYAINDYPKESFKAATLKLFECGNIAEDLMAKRLRLLPQIELLTSSEDGKQFKFSDFDDRFSGRIDGAIHGLVESPRKWHVWEHKSTDQKKFDELLKLKEKFGSKNALEQWNYSYYGTAILYMHYSQLDRHFMTVSTPGGRQYTSMRTEANPQLAHALVAKAKRLLDAKEPPAKISENKSFFKCKFCDFRDTCHG